MYNTNEDELSPMEMLVDALQELGYEVSSYSGRGMYGKKCPSFETNNNRDENILSITAQAVSAVAQEYEPDDVQEVADLFNDCRTDSMGLGTVVYFPQIDWNDDWSE